MKYAFVFLFSAASFMAGSLLQAQKVSGPKLTYKEDFVDYGEIEKGAPRERVWKFKNEGTEPLIIQNAVGSCGCTVPDPPKQPIPPGGEGVIRINYDTERVGPIAKTVTVTTNEPEGSNTHVIKVKGNVSAPKTGEQK
ncbi:MAG: DUF1573 domain-containing protein [Flavobacteriales bacterium]|nr:DUF1573 domain-containing protein [Flavobacteriales bacterium]MCX7650756.1 DUF1573 domain-containing protein [Flavobacteriales bacterium]MDW8433044.1 DUF1573 domain-containing protein [Flavobacteriales bacterium]